MALPSNVGKGTVIGSLTDSTGQPLTGKIILRPRFTAARVQTATPPVTILPQPVTVTLPTAPEPTGVMPPTDVVATDDPDLGLEPWTYQVSFKFDSGVEYGPFDISVPEGETVDLTLVAPAASVDGVQIMRGFGVPDTATAVDGDVVTYDEAAGATGWWSRADALGAALDDEFADPTSPIHEAIDTSLAAAADEALASSLSRTDRSRHAPSLGLYFPEAEGGDIQAALTAAGPSAGVVELAPQVHTITATLAVPAGVTMRGGTVTTTTAGRMISLGDGSVLDSVTVDAPGSVLGTMGAIEATGAGTRIRNCRFTATDRNAWHLAIQATATDTEITDTEFDRCAVGVFVNPGVAGLTVRNCRFTDWTNRCIAMNATTAGYHKIRIQDNEFGPLSAADATAGDVRCAVAIRSSQEQFTTRDIEVSGNRVYGNGLAHGDTSMGPADMLSMHRLEDARIVGNYLIDPGEVGIHVGQGGNKVVISDNIVLAADTAGIVVGEVTATYRTREITVTGNVVMDSNQDRLGTLPDTVTGGISLRNVDQAVVTGNRSGNTAGFSTQGHGIKVVDCTNVTVGPNALTNNRLGEHYGENNTGVTWPGTGSGPIYVVKSTDTTRNNTTTDAEDPELITEVGTNARYQLDALLIYESATAADLRVSWTRPSGIVIEWAMMALDANASGSSGSVEFARNIAGTSRGIGGSGAGTVATITGLVTTVQGGTLALKWAQRVAQPSDTIMRAGSYIKLTPIG